MGAAFRRFLLKLPMSKPLLHRVACETSSCEDSAAVAATAAAATAAYAGGRLVGLQAGCWQRECRPWVWQGSCRKQQLSPSQLCAFDWPKHTPTQLTAWL